MKTKWFRSARNLIETHPLLSLDVDTRQISIIGEKMIRTELQVKGANGKVNVLISGLGAEAMQQSVENVVVDIFNQIKAGSIKAGERVSIELYVLGEKNG